MHYWECEEVVARFKSFACCIETRSHNRGRRRPDYGSRSKPKYCCRVRNECSGRVVNFSIH